MIIGLTGPICSGKRAMAKYLSKKYGFIVINLLYLFKQCDDTLFFQSPQKKQLRDENMDSLD